MRAAVYTGDSVVSVEQVPTPAIGPGELLIRVESCGICHTDLKKIEYNLLAPPRIFGHETAGGGFSQYVRVMDWIVERGVEKIPDGVSFDRACFVEPVNTCVKGVVQLDPGAEDVVVILGQGPIGLLFTALVQRSGATMVATDTMPYRRELAVRFGAAAAFDPRDSGLQERIMDMTGGRGADSVIVAASAPGIVEQAVRYSRPGSRILLFAQTWHQERVEVSGADICVGERNIFGSYSASVDLQKQSADLVFSGALPVEDLISHRFPLSEIRSGIELALHPEPKSLKIIVQPQGWPE